MEGSCGESFLNSQPELQEELFLFVFWVVEGPDAKRSAQMVVG
jgi:hypothetical protein